MTALLQLLGRRDRRAVYDGNRWRREPGDPADLLDGHLRGHLLLGAVHGGDVATVRELAWDIDGPSHDKTGGEKHDAPAALDALTNVIRDHGLRPALVATSKSGDGIHARIVLDGDAPTADASALAKTIAAEANRHEVDCVYPSATGDGLVLALPLCGLQAPTVPMWLGPNGSRFVHGISLEPYPNDAQAEALAEWPKTPASTIPAAPVERVAVAQSPPITAWRKPLPMYRNELDVLAEECEFVRHCGSDVGSISYEEWFSLATVLSAFPGGAALFDAISACDSKRYEGAQAVRRKLDSISGKPRHCTNLGYRCGKLSECSAIGVRSPAGLPYKLKKKRSQKAAQS